MGLSEAAVKLAVDVTVTTFFVEGSQTLGNHAKSFFGRRTRTLTRVRFTPLSGGMPKVAEISGVNFGENDQNFGVIRERCEPLSKLFM